MFRKTSIAKQISMQSGVYQHLIGRSSNQFSDKTAWHNTFYSEIVSKIDEEIFSVLYSSDNGTPNSSIRILIGMMIIKEGKGYSDFELYENCRFNLLTRKALGVINMDEKIPTESTYYLLRQKMEKYTAQTGINLFEKCFEQIVQNQILEFNVSGKSVRMDSKLIGSNIAFYSRYELIHNTLKLFHKNFYKEQLDIFKLNNGKLLDEKNYKLLNEFIEEKSSNTVYKSTSDEINTRIVSLGNLISAILKTLENSKNSDYLILKRVFEEQYNAVEINKIDIKVEPKKNKEISAKSIQSPHDTDCTFRSKTGKKTKGFSHNITETNDKDNVVNLITNVQVAPATKADNDFVPEAIEKSEVILLDKIENIHADGAYNSQDNQAFTKEKSINFYLTGFQGKPSRYNLILENNELQVFDIQANTNVKVTLTKNNKYRIKTEKGFRYFTDKEIESCRLRKQSEELPKEISDKRNNVEATIFQHAYHLRKDKTKYRGLFKNKMWAFLRALWVNFVRIANHLTKNVNKTLLFGFFTTLLLFILNLSSLESFKKSKFAFC